MLPKITVVNEELTVVKLSAWRARAENMGLHLPADFIVADGCLVVVSGGAQAHGQVVDGHTKPDSRILPLSPDTRYCLFTSDTRSSFLGPLPVSQAGLC